MPYSKKLAGERFRRAREAAGLTKKTCVEIIKNTPGSDPHFNHMRLVRYERGEWELTPSEIHLLAPHLKVSPAYLLLLTQYETVYTVKQLNDRWQKGYDRGFKDGEQKQLTLLHIPEGI